MRSRILIVTIVLGLLAAACGGHSDNQESTDGGTSSTTAAQNGSGETPGQFGTMDEPVCGPGDASGATDQGVTDDSIKVGTLSDPGNTLLPGLLQEMFDASEAFVAWCNEAGGINGRQIELTLRDTKMLEAQQRITEACADDFMLVGGGSALDSTVYQARVDCGLAQIPGVLADPLAMDAPLQVSPPGWFGDYWDVTVARLGADQLGDAIKHYGLVTYNLQGESRSFSERIPEAVATAGYDTVYNQTVPPPPTTIDNWRPYVESMKSDGVQIYEQVSSPESVLPIMATMLDAGLHPAAVFGNRNQYSSALIEGNDALSEIPTWVETRVYPFEMADQNPPTRQFLDIMDAQVPGWSDNPKSGAVDSFSAWLLWALAAKECSSNLTRECVLEKAAAVGEWDAGGISAPNTVTTDPDPAGPWCGAVMRATPDGFEYDEEFTQPNKGIFNCDDANLVKTPA